MIIYEIIGMGITKLYKLIMHKLSDRIYTLQQFISFG